MAAPTDTDPAADVILVDTNILIIYARHGEPAEKLETMLGLQSGTTEALTSVVSIGEALSFAKKSGWGGKRQAALDDLIRLRLVPVDINRPEILTAYAEIDYHCEKVLKPARPMSKNDLWIAATACVLQCTLVTTDTDFDHLHGKQLQRRWINPALLRPTSHGPPHAS